ncbi:MAG: hypothetical protein HYZ11_06045 [Candidatus Tectomicrobia bacterium]|uniref:Uncharacterized protein n=1 Tax=Tectimicrobiota bacterium TaxID=2528274 RepID=A0A932HZF6_UNCTE|nr:hypothetical protein [Candidatus Tectomicrobia bacterium]
MDVDKRNRRQRWPEYQQPIEPEVITIVPFREDFPVFGTVPSAGMSPPEKSLRADTKLPARGKIIDTWG